MGILLDALCAKNRKKSTMTFFSMIEIWKKGLAVNQNVEKQSKKLSIGNKFLNNKLKNINIYENNWYTRQ